MDRPATASLRSATLKENTPCFLFCAGGKFFLKKERVFSFRVLPSKYSGRWRGSMRTRFCENYFLGRKMISQNLGSDFPRAGGVWGGMRAGLLLDFWRTIDSSAQICYHPGMVKKLAINAYTYHWFHKSELAIFA
jgi:hypothetical protein